MGLCKLIVIVGVAALVMQPSQSASIGGQSNACLCTREYFPVCGSDGQTYSNKCVFECEKAQSKDLELMFYGDCADQPANDEMCICTREYNPICGTDGTTYSNKCMFQCEQKTNKALKFASYGQCVEIQNLPMDNGVPEVQNLPMDNEIPEIQNLPLDDEVMCLCTFLFAPVCGNDGKTYSNKCVLNCAQKTNKALKFASYGQCVEIQNLPMDNEIPEIQNLPMDNVIPEVQQYGAVCACTKEYNPICGSDGQTYSNKCTFKCEQKTNKALKFASYGQCVEIQNLPMDNVIPEVQQYGAPCLCTREYKPVCGSDGHTYSNKCMFKCEQKINKNLEILTSGKCPEIQNLPMDNVIPEVQNLPLDGEIPEVQNLPLDNVIPKVQNLPLDDEVMCACAYIYDPVCGTDGKTYPNKCALECAQKTDKALKFASFGQCVEIQNLPMDNVIPEVQNLPMDNGVPEVQNLPLDDEVMCLCTYIFAPVCGNDGKTYSNKCVLKCAQKTNKQLELFATGACDQLRNFPVQN